MAKTGDGEGSVWKVIEDKSAPAGGAYWRKSARGQASCSICALPKLLPFVTLSCRRPFRPLRARSIREGASSGDMPMRVTTTSRSFNPLESNFRLYKVVDGKRMQLATKEGLQARPASGTRWRSR